MCILFKKYAAPKKALHKNKNTVNSAAQVNDASKTNLATTLPNAKATPAVIPMAAIDWFIKPMALSNNLNMSYFVAIAALIKSSPIFLSE